MIVSFSMFLRQDSVKSAVDGNPCEKSVDRLIFLLGANSIKTQQYLQRRFC
jgi:hypothetical protein